MSIYTNYNNYNSTSNLLGTMFGSAASSSSVFDVSAATSSAEAMLNAVLDKSSGTSATTSTESLKKETAQFLDSYILQMKNLSQSANKLKNGGVDKVLYNKEGEITEDTIKDTVKSVQDLLSSYNNTLSFLNKNGDRGSGVMAQLEKMAGGIMSENKLELLGISIKKDGSMELDEEVLTGRLSEGGDYTIKLTKDLLGGQNGLADKIDAFANKAVNTSAQKLIENDLADIQSLQASTTGIYSDYLLQAKSGAYGLSNLGFLNMLNTYA